MKKIILIFTLLITTVTFSQNKNAKASMEVDGVCGMCKERIEKAAIRTKGVKSAVWSIDTHELKLMYDERKTNLETISKNIAAVGHDTKEIKATDEAYDSVHPCCRYRDKEIVDDHKEEKKSKKN
ncbi:heavy-metal-associated domain-containing protein [Winogradskyella marincola]|uniref:Heavy-metal-associated domain-containing protein n=1 Tax=Winogradskyella marincola TaxID=3037795 RepID=A0ABT6FYA4_9FLAO|nr:heavy-metal-associated domain-containing protein [Winogradskyella sp. YYF002]MDG4714645.1 heavy-metal-associated domain-containing protein [Winogradskyella sp. YYF002]